MILAQFSVLPFKNMGLRVWAICQVTGDQWVSREGSLSPFFFFFLASDAKCQFWVIITRGVTVSELGAGFPLLWFLKNRIGLPGESHSVPEVTSRWQERAELWLWSLWGGVPLLSVPLWVPSFHWAISTLLQFTWAPHLFPISFCSGKDTHCWGSNTPLSPFSEIEQFQRRKQVPEKETMRMVECFNPWLKFWVK